MSERNEVADEEVPHEAGAPQDAKPPADAPPEESVPDGAARPTVAPRSTGWRDQAVGTALAAIPVGVWLVVSPEALGYGAGDATWNPVIGGVLVVVLSAARLARPREARPIALTTIVVGVWLAASAFAFEAPPAGQLNQAGFGAIAGMLSLIGLAGAQRGRELNQR